MTHILEIPFTYSMIIRRHRKRNTETVKVASSVPVILREVTSDAAPVIAVLPYPNRLVQTGPKVELRFHEGKFWIPKIDYNGGSVYEILQLEKHLNSLEKGKVHGPMVERNDPDFKEISWDNHDQLLEEVREWATQDILIDGVPYETTDEPYYVATPDGYNRMKIELNAEGYDRVDKTQVWRLDRWAELRQVMERAFEDGVSPYDLKRHASLEPEILRPDLLLIEDDGPALLAGLRGGVKSMDEDFLAKASMDSLISFGKLRDALAAEVPDLAAIADLGEDFNARLDAEDLHSWRSGQSKDTIVRWRDGKGREHDFESLDL